MKRLFLPLGLLFLVSFCYAQKKIERISIQWPIEYEWKIVHQEDNGDRQTVIIIPGKASIKTASILGSLVTYSNRHKPDIKEVIKEYKNAVDSGSFFSVIETEKKGKYPWALFKVEAPKSKGNIQVESDLYFVIQGEYALYEIYVAIKKPFLDASFIKKWSEVFKSSKIQFEE